ncbi:hypothetical protein DFJ58DRAFT_688826 [Suillus subalutaceus]|uniref:uncharacterized protein n=1 Tax=Suillus subalutaceus TaxID=48586 RepID=UPI001B85F001|nr:uncharacterized protein DFJ58DRAFT_688826 [Suillus subalutaceus]KAG1841125.1 hypothetical protein DFJ58DRAFT_688826 [Suillus subalutaceus]
MLVLSIFLLVSAILPFTIGDTHGRDKRGHHQELAQRARGDVGIHKRAFNNARFTFYDVGLGACGQYSSPGDFIVALNVAQYGGGFPGPQCFKSITISFGGKTAQATIMDECMGCPYGGLDFSIGLFSHFASEAAGVLYGSWWFDDGASEPAPSTSSAWTPTSTPDWSTPTPTHQYHPADTPSTTPTAQISIPSETATSTLLQPQPALLLRHPLAPLLQPTPLLLLRTLQTRRCRPITRIYHFLLAHPSPYLSPTLRIWKTFRISAKPSSTLVLC